MKAKYITIIITLFIVSTTGYSQLRVDQYGRIGMGTNWPNPGYKCHIKGNLLLTTYPNSFYELQLKVGNGWPGTEIGSNIDKIAFWSSWVGYNKLYAEALYKQSDSTLKSNIIPIKDGLNIILKLNAYSYNLKDNQLSDNGDKKQNTRAEYGFISQEVEKALPTIQITEDLKGIKLMDYDQIIPLTVSAIKEQQLIIDSLKFEVTKLKKIVSKNNSETVKDIDGNFKFNKTVLYQNKPNPFNEKTIIEYEIKEVNLLSASIIIFDMNGTLLQSYPINSIGKNQLTINGRELKAGMYIYTLIINNNEVDTKRMILLK